MRLHDLKRGLWKAAMRLPFPLSYRLLGVRAARRAKRRARELAGQGLGTPLDASLAKRWRTSDTLFVLGSGASINQMTDAHWNAIAGADSIGFNFWPMHPFVPTFYVFEEPGVERAVLLYRLLAERAEDYRSTRIIAKTLAKFTGERFPEALRPNLHLSPDWALPVEDETGLRRALAYLRRTGALEGPAAIEAIPFKRASVSYLLFWALAMGYRRIVLCGIDLNHSRYFYEDRLGDYPPTLVPDRSAWGSVHRTMDSRVEELTVDRIVYATNELVLRPAGVELFVASPASALHPALPCYFPVEGASDGLSAEAPP